MSTLTDQQKADIIANGGDNPVPPPSPGDDDNPEDHEEPNANPTGTPGVTDEGNPTPPPEGEKPPIEGEQPPEATPPATFTKQFPNLKGEDWPSYGPELENAYQNSFTEGMRLKGELDKALTQIRELTSAPAGPPPVPPADAPPPVPPPNQPPSGLQQTAEFQWLQSAQQAEMRRSFGSFMKIYPQVTDETNFKVFSDAVQPVTDMFARIEGRQPTYDELFPKIADVLGWQPESKDGIRGQAIKEAAASGSPSAVTPAPGRTPAVSDAEVMVFLRMNPGMSRDDAMKEIAKIKADPMAATR